MFLFLICHPDLCHSMVTYIKWDNQNYLFESQNNETSTYDWNKLRDILGLPHDLCLNLRTGWGELSLSLIVAHGRWWQSMCGPPSQVCAISLTATPGSPWNKTLYSLCDYAHVIFLFLKNMLTCASYWLPAHTDCCTLKRSCISALWCSSVNDSTLCRSKLGVAAR